MTGTRVTGYNGRQISLFVVLTYNMGLILAHWQLNGKYTRCDKQQNRINRDVLCVLSDETLHDYHVIRYTRYIYVHVYAFAADYGDG